MRSQSIYQKFQKRYLRRAVKATLKATKPKGGMVSQELQSEIRRLFYVEHMKVYAISRHLRVSRDAVRRILGVQRFSPEAANVTRPGKLTPYLPLIEEQ